LEGTNLFLSHSDSDKKLSATDIIKMLEYFINNIFVLFDGRVLQHTVGMSMGTNCAPLLADLFLYSYQQTSYNGFSWLAVVSFIPSSMVYMRSKKSSNLELLSERTSSI
jgi:hypothetical protein